MSTLEDVSGADQERLQQLLELQMREGDVADRLRLFEPRLPRLPLRLEQLRMVDRHRGPVGDELQELRVEGVRRERRDA